LEWNWRGLAKRAIGFAAGDNNRQTQALSLKPSGTVFA
jgi:hypothetical protein